MKTLIVYRTTHGCTERIAREIGARIGGKVDYADLKQKKLPAIKEYDRIIVGGSIHAGQIQHKVKEFCAENRELLLGKELGLFICCMYEGDVARKQLQDAFPADLLAHTKSILTAGGSVNLEKMNFLERFAVKKMAHLDQSMDHTDMVAVERFARKMDRAFIPMMLFV